MLADDLAIMVFTYNRAENLRRTLEQLESSPFAGCRITVLDNHSTDATPEVCREFEGRFERYRTVRHARNIGLGPNYLRAVELSEGRYSWILSDDERFDFGDCGDVIEAIEAGEVDLISLGSPAQQEWERGQRASARELYDRGQRFFFVFTFVAGVIFRTEHFDSSCMTLGYRNVDNLYPQFEHIHQCLEQDRDVLVSRNWIVRRNVRQVHETVGSHLYWFLTAVRSNRLIRDPAVRRRANWDTAASKPAWVVDLAARIAMERIDRPDGVRRLLAELFLFLDGPQRAILVALWPMTFVPGGVYRRLRRVYDRRRGIAESGPVPEHDVMRL